MEADMNIAHAHTHTKSSLLLLCEFETLSIVNEYDRKMKILITNTFAVYVVCVCEWDVV